MIASVKQYGGFYVGRYEMGNGVSNISRLAVLPIVNKNWYELYSMAKAYNKTGVTTDMIWGSQYDAVLNYALTNSLVSSKVNANTRSNYGKNIFKTGTRKGSSCINNIFDLDGNAYEFTKYGNGWDSRSLRGGDTPNSNFLGAAAYSNSTYTTRIALFIDPSN